MKSVIVSVIGLGAIVSGVVATMNATRSQTLRQCELSDHTKVTLVDDNRYETGEHHYHLHSVKPNGSVSDVAVTRSDVLGKGLVFNPCNALK